MLVDFVGCLVWIITGEVRHSRFLSPNIAAISILNFEDEREASQHRITLLILREFHCIS
jgi:hypothetical protein